MSVPSSPPGPVSPPNAGGGCLSIVLVIVGVILLLPGICVIGFMIADRMLIPTEGLILSLWLICFAISAFGIYLLVIVARRHRRSAGS